MFKMDSLLPPQRHPDPVQKRVMDEMGREHRQPALMNEIDEDESHQEMRGHW